MIVGIPKEIKTAEKRVAMTPHGVHSLASRGRRVLVEKGAGEGSGFSDEDYKKAGAVIVERAKDIWGTRSWW